MLIRATRPKESIDGWCGRPHSTNSYPPEKKVTSLDYFELGNYEYDRGNCVEAIDAYNMTIKLNPNYPQGYNNRGYTYMRMREFEKALVDLNMAIKLRPDYVNALRNRADVYSNLEDYEKARVDYEQAIDLGGSRDLCGDLFTAKYEKTGLLNKLLQFPRHMIECGRR